MMHYQSEKEADTFVCNICLLKLAKSQMIDVSLSCLAVFCIVETHECLLQFQISWNWFDGGFIHALVPLITRCPLINCKINLKGLSK